MFWFLSSSNWWHKKEGKETEKADLEFWMSPSSVTSYDFLLKFKSSLDAFEGFVTLHPKYKFKNLAGKMSEDFLKRNCFGEGLFCATDNEVFEPKSVLTEGIRQICIWNISSLKNDGAQMWWEYINHYRDCLNSKMKHAVPSGQHCFDIISGQMDLPDETKREIQKCLETSFAFPDDKFHSQNIILESNMNSQEYKDVYLVPAVFVNDVLVKEDLKNKVMISAVCEKLITKPSICSTYLTSEIDWDYQKKMSGDTNIAFFIVLFAFAVLVLFLILVLLKRTMGGHINSEINNEVRSHVTEYMRLRDSTNS